MTKRNGICDDRVVQAGLTMKNVQLDVGDDGEGMRPQNRMKTEEEKEGEVLVSPSDEPLLTI